MLLSALRETGAGVADEDASGHADGAPADDWRVGRVALAGPGAAGDQRDAQHAPRGGAALAALFALFHLDSFFQRIPTRSKTLCAAQERSRAAKTRPRNRVIGEGLPRARV